MTEFKFLRGYVGTLNVMDGETYATASLNDDTPEGHMNRRMLYHTNRDLYDRLRHPNNEMELYFYERGFRETPRGQFGTPERHRDIIRRINGQRDLNDNPIRLFQTTTVTKVNPKWWMKIKMFFQEANFNGEIVGIIFIASSLTIAAILTISKLLNAW
jgi:hypothetical protein